MQIFLPHYNFIIQYIFVIIVYYDRIAPYRGVVINGAFLWDDPEQDQWSSITRIRSNELMNPLWTRILWFIWCTMIRVILDHWSWSGSSQRNAPEVYVMLCYVMLLFFPLSIPRDNIKARNKFKLERKKYLRQLEVPHYKKILL